MVGVGRACGRGDAAGIQRQLRADGRLGDRDLRDLRRQSPLPDVGRWARLVRPRSLFRPWRLWRGVPCQDGRIADDRLAARRPVTGLAWRGGVRFLRRAIVRRLFRDADPGVRADRLVDRVPVGHGDRWRQRHSGRVAGEMGGRPGEFLLAVARLRRTSGRGAPGHRVLAVRLCTPRHKGFAAAQRSDRHQRQARAVDGLRDRRHRRRLCRGVVRLSQGQRLPRQSRHLAVGRCTGHGAARRLRDRLRRGDRRHRLQGAQHLAGQPDRSVKTRARRLHRADRGGLPQGHRRDAGDDPQSPPVVLVEISAPHFPNRDRRMSMVPTLLSVEGLSKSYGGVHAVRNVSFELRAGEILALIGPNGAGKSTCFDMLNGQNIPDSGRINLLGEDTAGRKPRAIWRLGVGRTFQITATFPTMTVRENVQVALVSYGRQLFNLWASTPRFAREEAGRLLELVGMSGYAERPCGELAYGDLKRLELAIALANQPKLLLMDEPTAGMAPRERIELMRLTACIAREKSIGVLFTEHDMDVVFEHADRILVLNRGTLIAEGSPEEVRRNPQVRAIYLGEGLVYDARHREGVLS